MPLPETRISVTITLPKAAADAFGPDEQTVARRILEYAVVEGYRSRGLSRGQVAQMLDLDWEETEEFLANHGCFRHYDLEDLEQDRKNLERLLGPS